MKNHFRLALVIWQIITALVVASVVAIYLRNGMKGIDLFIQQWPLSIYSVMLESAALTWLCFGAILYLLANEKINASNILTVAGFFIVMLVYLNFLRERFRYGDYAYYIEAGTAMLQHKTLPDTYLYLPLWAALMQYIVPLGDEGVLAVLWLVNMIALGAFYFLLHRVLERYGFAPRFAALTATLFILINAPIQRTLGYTQVNLIVLDLIFISVLTYPKNSFISALTLALAIHLKTSPAVLVLAFLLERDWRWLAWFALTFLLIALIPVATNGISPYYDYLNNINILTKIPDTNFHDTSFDSFFRFLNPFFGIKIETTRIIVLIFKATLGVATVTVMARNVINKTFAAANILNALPALFVMMTLASPIVWDHHGVFTALSFLVLLKTIESPAAWIWFAFAYFLEFIMPSFDFFPWSYGRLLAPMILLGIMWGLAKKQEGSRLFNSVNNWLKILSPLPLGEG